MKTNHRLAFQMSALSVIVLCVVAFFSGCVYMKMSPPADVDKAGVPPEPSDDHDVSCWMATASNMLAGAGYGQGNTLQDRADDIYADMVAQYGLHATGWIDSALNWWLNSVHNDQPNNPYQDVTVYGYKSPRYPWDNVDGPQFIGNELRECHFVGFSISWPTAGSSIGSGGHAFTCWGDNFPKMSLYTNPTRVRVTDSDTDTGGDVQVYSWDDYTSPNPGGSNEGNGWYMDYSDNHPYVKHICTLSPIETPGQLIQKVTGSYKIHQNNQDEAASDLHYRVGTDVEILTYSTELNVEADPPTIDEIGDPRTQLLVNWVFTESIPYCSYVIITTEFILSNHNAIYYDDVHFTYSKTREPLPIPTFGWKMITPQIEDPEAIENVTGGYVVGEFEILVPGEENPLLYRFIHEYRYEQDPQNHEFILYGQGNNTDATVTNFRFGHSYGYLDANDLWEFEDWLIEDDKQYPLEQVPTIGIEFDLPYPPGDE